MILEGPTITDCYKETTPAALSIAQLLKFNSIKYGRKESTNEAVSVAQETPVPTTSTLKIAKWHPLVPFSAPHISNKAVNSVAKLISQLHGELQPAVCSFQGRQSHIKTT